MIEYAGPDGAQARRSALLVGVEKACWVQVGDFAPRTRDRQRGPRARRTAEKTSAVHFLRFELTPAMVAAVKGGAPIRVGVDHPHYQAEITVSEATRASLAADLA